jgi:uncharacterized protein (TIGR02996 family)
MPDPERGFLKQIAADVEDRATRLVYADWLEEGGDPRGELIRIEEEVRGLPLYSDRYWKLKPRRQELLGSAKKAWLKRMGYGDDSATIFATVPEGWKERWRLIRLFTERWFGYPMNDAGGKYKRVPRRDPNPGGKPLTVSDFPTVEQVRSFPPSLREWFVFVGELRRKVEFDPKGTMNFASFGTGVEDDHFLRFGSQDDFHFFVSKTKSRDPDPAVNWVEMQDCGRDEATSGTIPHLTTMAFLTTLQLLRCGWGRTAGGFVVEEGSLPLSVEDLVERLTETFPARSRFDEHEVFERPDLIAVLGPAPLSGIVDSTGTHLQVEGWTGDDLFDFLAECRENAHDEMNWGRLY